MKTLAQSCMLFVLLFLCGTAIYAQQKQPVKLFFEKVYLHTDRDEYTQGDTIWYKAYVLNSQGGTPMYGSGNLYVELIAKDSSKIISREIIRLTGGTGNAEFALDDSIPSGKYQLRAYTNWMRNFGNNFIFEKDITIVNTIVSIPKNTARLPVASRKSANAVSSNIVAKPSVPVIRFYPESGALVEGVNSLVGVKAENSWGMGIPVKGAVLNNAGDTTAVFNCDSLGFGLFVLLPVKGQVYYAVITSAASKPKYTLPQALLKGFSLRVNHRDSLLTVIVNCNDAALADNKGRAFILSGKGGGKTYFRQLFAIDQTQTLIKIPDSLFPSGIAALTLLEDGPDQSKPHCERLVYTHHPAKRTTLSVSTDKAVYQTKDKVTANIKTGGSKANLSVAVVDGGVAAVQTWDIVSYVQLQSELRGVIEKPLRYFDTSNVNRAKQLDLLLLTQGWRDFVWRRMQDTAIRLSYSLENGLTVSGKIKSGNSGKPLSKLNITMFANSNKGTKLFSTVSDSSGRFLFNDLEQYGDHNVKLSASDNKGEKKGAFDVDTLSILPVPPVQNVTTAQKDTINKGLISIAIKRRALALAEQSKGAKSLKEVKITGMRNIVLGNGTPMTGWGKDQTFNITPKDYQYKTLEWFVIQKVKGAMASSIDTITGVVVRSMDVVIIDGKCVPKSKLLPPQFFINGRDYTTDNEVESEVYRKIYYPLSIENFKQIVVKQFIVDLGCILGDRYIIYIYLKDDALVGYNPGVSNPLLNGYYNAWVFYKPVYDSPTSKVRSDLRTIIHWQPNVNTDENGNATINFYNADAKGNMRIVVQGITDKGLPLSTIYTYTVK